MNKDSYQVSVIIVNYNTPFLLKDCIRSIYTHTRDLHFEIIVVDNASDVNPAELLQEEFPNVKFIISLVNLGFGKANNLGVEQAGGEFLFFLNSDTILLNDAISILYNFISKNSSVGICGANLYDENNNPNQSYFNFPSFCEDLRIFLPPQYIIPQISQLHNFSNQNRRVDCISGADLMISKELFMTVGGFDPDFFMYYEETELTYRVKMKGYTAYSIPQAKIIHYHGMSTTVKGEDLKSWAKQEFLFSRFLYFKKSGKTYYPAYFKNINLLKCLGAFVFYSLLNNREKLIYWSNKREFVETAYERFQSFLKNKARQ